MPTTKYSLPEYYKNNIFLIAFVIQRQCLFLLLLEPPTTQRASVRLMSIPCRRDYSPIVIHIIIDQRFDKTLIHKGGQKS